jgi:hypothetical protein
MADLRWMSSGGLLLDGTGDIATTLSPLEELNSMVMTRLKAAVNAWKLYSIGAGLEVFPGNPVNANTELSIQRAVTASLTRQFLPSGSFTVQTLAIGNSIEVYVYMGRALVANTSLVL